MLSIRITIGSPTQDRSSILVIFKNHYTSRAGLSKAYYLAAIDDSVIILCFLEYYYIGVLPKNHTTPLVDLESCQLLYKALV